MKNIISVFTLSIILLGFQSNSQAQTEKPLIWVKGVNSQVISLYQKCNNQLSIGATNTKGEEISNPKFEARNAQITKIEKQGRIELYPEKGSKEVVLIISDGEIVIDSITFPVREIPAPKLEVRYNGELINLKKGISLNGYSEGELKIDIVPDRDFSSFFPKEARYIMSDVVVTLGRDKRAISSQTISYLGEANILKILERAESGDRLVLEVPRLVRIDSQDNAEKVNGISTILFTIPLN